MQKIISLVIGFSFFSGTLLQAQQTEQDPQTHQTQQEPQTEQDPQTQQEPQVQQTGIAATTSSNASLENNWQNWAFAGSAMISAAAGVFIISLHNGKSSSSH